MPAFVAALLGGLLQIAASLVGRILIALSIGYATYTGVQASIDWAKTQAISYLTSAAIPANAIAAMGMLKIDVCVSILFSALGARLVLRGLKSDAVTRLVIKSN